MTANERRGAESALVGTVFAPPHRAERIARPPRRARRPHADDFAAIHNDTLLATVGACCRGLGAGESSTDWDGRMDAASVDAARWAAWRTRS